MNNGKRKSCYFIYWWKRFFFSCLFGILQDKEVHLITCNSGIGIKSELSEMRVKELIERFPNNIVGRTILPTYGLFRSIAIKILETDFKRWGINLVLLGDKLAIHAAATVYCLEHGIKNS